MKYSIKWLLEKVEKERMKYIFFWGHRPHKDGKITHSIFSQWWLESFTVEGVEYKSAEHWMMAGKARLFDHEMVNQIIEADSPALAKKLGRKIKNFDSKVWNEHKYEIVVEGNIHKFSQHEGMKQFLIDTGQRVLVEASPVDSIWGIGLSKDDESVYDPIKWKGENLLGFALMEVRDHLVFNKL